MRGSGTVASSDQPGTGRVPLTGPRLSEANTSLPSRRTSPGSIPQLRPPAPSLRPPGPPAAARASEDVLSAAGLRWSAWGIPFALTAPARSPGSDPPPATHTRHFQQAVVPHPDASPPTPHVAMAPGSDSKLGAGAVGAPASPAPARPASGQAPLWWRLTPGCLSSVPRPGPRARHPTPRSSGSAGRRPLAGPSSPPPALRAPRGRRLGRAFCPNRALTGRASGVAGLPRGASLPRPTPGSEFPNAVRRPLSSSAPRVATRCASLRQK